MGRLQAGGEQADVPGAPAGAELAGRKAGGKLLHSHAAGAWPTTVTSLAG